MSLWVQDVEDRLTELEALDKVLQEGLGKFINTHQLSLNICLLTLSRLNVFQVYDLSRGMNGMAIAEAYDRLASDLVGAKDRLTRILVSKDKRATVSEAV